MGVRGVPTGRVSGRRGGARGARRHRRGRGRGDDRRRRSRPDRPAGGAGVLDASVTGPATAVTDQVSAAEQRRTLTYWTPRRMQGATAASLPRSPIRTTMARGDPDAGAAGAEPGRFGRHRAQGDPDREPVLRIADDRGALLHHGRQGPFLHRIGGGLDGGRPGAHGGALRLLERVRGQHRVRARVPRRKAAVRGVAGRARSRSRAAGRSRTTPTSTSPSSRWPRPAASRSRPGPAA